MIRIQDWFLAIVAAAVVLWMTWSTTWSALAHAAPMQGCGITWKQLFYQARTSDLADRQFEVQVGIPVTERNAVAQIWSKTHGCQALCRTQSFERDAHLNPVQLEMECVAPGPVPLNAPATLIWSKRPNGVPTLRFGTWLGGYTHSRLEVLRDTYSQPQLTPRKLAKVD